LGNKLFLLILFVRHFQLLHHFILSQLKIKREEYMSLYLILYFGPSTVFLENSKIFGRQLFKHLRPQSSATTSFSIFFDDVIWHFFLSPFLQKYLQIRLYTLFLLAGMGVMAKYPVENWFSPINTSHPSRVRGSGE